MPNKDGTGRLGQGKDCDQEAKDSSQRGMGRGRRNRGCPFNKMSMQDMMNNELDK